MAGLCSLAASAPSAGPAPCGPPPGASKASAILDAAYPARASQIGNRAGGCAEHGDTLRAVSTLWPRRPGQAVHVRPGRALQSESKRLTGQPGHSRARHSASCYLAGLCDPRGHLCPVPSSAGAGRDRQGSRRALRSADRSCPSSGRKCGPDSSAHSAARRAQRLPVRTPAQPAPARIHCRDQLEAGRKRDAGHWHAPPRRSHRFPAAGAANIAHLRSGTFR